jgi:hydrogenase maturation protein HypF
MKAIKLPFKVKRPILATGADIKGSFALADGGAAYLFEGFNDLRDICNMSRFSEAVRSASKRLGIQPRVIACDHHPGYSSTRFAQMYGLENFIEKFLDIQHHEAHVASAIVDNDIKEGVIGAAFDGTGLGWDGCIWGGEFLVGSPKSFKRAAHFEYVPMPGAEAAITQPWRMAAAHLYGAFGADFLRLGIAFTGKLDRGKWRIIKKMIDRRINSPQTSSAGRLFDAAAAMVLCRMRSEGEASLPVEFERIAAGGRSDFYGFDIKTDAGKLLVGYKRLFDGMVKDISKGMSRAVISAKFHNTVSRVICEVALRLRKTTGKKAVVLSGGVFQNRYLTARAVKDLRSLDFIVFTHSRISANDSGIPIGQIAIANARPQCA